MEPSLAKAKARARVPLLRISQSGWSPVSSAQPDIQMLRTTKEGLCSTSRPGTVIVSCSGRTWPNSPGKYHRQPSRSSNSYTAYSVPR